MMLAAVVAADAAVVRAVVHRNEYFSAALFWLVATMPVAIALQSIVLLLRSGQGRPRLVWIGVLVSGIAGLSNIVWHLSDPPAETITISTSGTSREIDPGSPAARVWEPYLSATYEWLDRLGLRGAGKNRWISTSQDALVFFLPQLLVALAGGLIAHTTGNRLFSMWNARRARSPREPIGRDDRQPNGSGLPSDSRSHKASGSAKWLEKLTSIVAVFIIAMIASGMAGLFGKRKNNSRHAPAELLKLAPLVDDLKFFAPSAQSD